MPQASQGIPYIDQASPCLEQESRIRHQMAEQAGVNMARSLLRPLHSSAPSVHAYLDAAQQSRASLDVCSPPDSQWCISSPRGGLSLPGNIPRGTMQKTSRSIVQPGQRLEDLGSRAVNPPSCGLLGYLVDNTRVGKRIVEKEGARNAGRLHDAQWWSALYCVLRNFSRDDRGPGTWFSVLGRFDGIKTRGPGLKGCLA